MVKTLCLVHSWCLLSVFSHGRRGRGLLWKLFYKWALIPLMKAETPKGVTFYYYHLSRLGFHKWIWQGIHIQAITPSLDALNSTRCCHSPEVQMPWHTIAANQLQNVDVTPDEGGDKKWKYILIVLLYFVVTWSDWEMTESYRKEEFLKLTFLFLFLFYMRARDWN